MKTQGRKNVHGKGGVRSKAAYTTSKYKAMLRTLVTDLIVKGSVTVTLSTARDLVSLADKMVTLGKANTLASRRQAAELIRFEKAEDGQFAIQKLFSEIAPKYQDRNGGYTQILKLAERRGDDALMVILKLNYIGEVDTHVQRTKA